MRVMSQVFCGGSRWEDVTLTSELGYYYPDNDVAVATELLLSVIEHHDEDVIGYRTKQQNLLRKYTSENRELVSQYDQLLNDLIKT